MNIQEMQNEIKRLKKERDICILAHAYQSHDIWEVADYVGDSFGLAEEAAKAPQKTVIMCGVRFMADTVKLLSPEKKVILPEPDAGCPMAEQIEYDMLVELKKQNPECKVVAYVNTTTDIKTLSDVCVTSSSAVKIVKNMKEKDILFIPDCNLGAWVKEQVPEKNIKLVSGGCPTHFRITAADVEKAKAAHPNAKLLVHPECRPEVTAMADYAGSTTGIMKYAAESTDKEFIIGTENSIVSHLQLAHPEKKFYPLSKECICHNMKLTTLGDVYNSVKGDFGEEIILSEETIKKARVSIDNMLALG